MSTEEMNAALDDLGIPGGDEPIINADPPINDPPPVEDPIEEPIAEPEAKPPGYISYQDWVDDGKDPDDWQGKNKYSQQYDLIQNNKEFKSELRGMNDLLRQTVDATTSMQEDAYKRGMAEAKVELDAAIESEDVNAVIAAKDKMADLTPPQAAPKANPIHGQFFSSNAVLDQSSAQFDPEFKGEFERIYNGRLQADGVRPDQQLSERAIQGYMNSALKSAKELFPDKFESPRNNRQAVKPNAKRAAPSKTPGDNIKGMHITTKNPRDTNALSDVYEAIKAKDPKAAEAFAEKMGVQ